MMVSFASPDYWRDLGFFGGPADYESVEWPADQRSSSIKPKTTDGVGHRGDLRPFPVSDLRSIPNRAQLGHLGTGKRQLVPSVDPEAGGAQHRRFVRGLVRKAVRRL